MPLDKNKTHPYTNITRNDISIRKQSKRNSIMARTKTSPKPKSKKAATGSKPKATAKAKKATKNTTKAQAKPLVILTEGTLVKFNGYGAEADEADKQFETGDVLYIAEVVKGDEDGGTMYNCVHSDDVLEFIADPDSDDIDGGEVKPGEVTALTGRALSTATEQFMPIKAVGQMQDILNEDDDLVALASSMYEEVQEKFFYLGGVLAHVLQTGAHLKENGGDFSGDDAFQDFCMATFDHKESWGRDLARIYVTFSSIPDFDPADLAKIGWSKAREIQKHVTEDNVEELIEVASTTTKRELPDVLRTKYVTGNTTASGKEASRNTIKMVVLNNLKFTEEGANTVELALAEAMKVFGTENQSEAFEAILTQWLSDHFGEDDRKSKTLRNKIAKARAAANKKAPAKKTEEKASAKKPAKPSKKPTGKKRSKK